MILAAAACAFSVSLAATRALPEPVRMDDVVTDTARFVGRWVRLEGRVASTFGPRMFRLGPLNGADNLAVVMPHLAVDQPLREGRLVLLSGRVWLSSEELFVGWPALEPLRATLLAFAGRPVIVADSVRPAGGPQLVASPPAVRTIERIVSAPDKPSLLGRRVVLSAVAVHDMTGPRSFTVRDDAGRLLLVELDDTEASYAPWFGERVDVDGVVGMAATAVYPWSLLPAPAASATTEPLYVQARRVSPSELPTP